MATAQSQGMCASVRLGDERRCLSRRQLSFAAKNGRPPIHEGGVGQVQLTRLDTPERESAWGQTASWREDRPY